MDPQDLDRIAFVTRHFRELQGLRKQVPVGMLLLNQGLTPVMQLTPLSLRLLSLEIIPVCLIALFAGSMALMRWAPRHYRNLFGEAEVRGRAAPSSYWLVYVLACLVLLVLIAKGSLSAWRVLCVLFGAFHLAAWCRREHRPSQSHCLLLGGILMAFVLLVPIGFSGSGQKLARSMADITGPTLARVLDPAEQALFSCGVGLSRILAGLLDHRQLVDTLGHLPPDLDEAGAAMAATPARLAMAEMPEMEETR